MPRWVTKLGRWVEGAVESLVAIFGVLLVFEGTLSRDLSPPVRTIAHVLLSIAVLLAVIVLRWGFRSAAHKLTEEFLASLLKACLAGFTNEQINSFNLRCNVMLPYGDNLRIILRYPDLKRATGVPWAQGEGVCGTAFEERREVMARDLTPYRGRDYSRILVGKGKDRHRLWGMTERQWEMTRNLGSVISLPLISAGDDGKVLGILNVDSSEKMSSWLPSDTEEAKFLTRLRTLSGPMTRLLSENKLIKGAYLNGPARVS